MRAPRLMTLALAGLACIFIAQSANACGWYAIAACSTEYDGLEAQVERHGGYIVNTNDYANFAGGYFCVVVGPKTKQAARITAERMQDRGSYDAYIKYSC